MKKKLIVLFTALILTVATAVSNADMGMPTSPLYTVVTHVNGTHFVHRNRDGSTSEGVLAGGQTFYVWMDYDENYYEGTTNPNADMADPDDEQYFVSIPKNEVMRSSDTVSPDSGTYLDEAVRAVATEPLGIRCGPGYGFNKLAEVETGTRLAYDCTFTTDTAWMYVKSGETSGWVNGNYLRTMPKNTVSTEPAATDTDKQDKPEEEEEDTAESKRTSIIGMVFICIGSAIIAAAIAYYILSRRTDRR